MQIAAPPANPSRTVDMPPSVHEPTVEPTAVIVSSPTPEPVLVEDSDTGLEYDHDENQWVVSPPHPSQFVEPPPPRPVYYIVTVGEEAGVYDGTWVETFDIRRVSRLEQFSFRVFHDWPQAHAYYTQQYKLNHVANTPRPGNSERTPSVAPARVNLLVANPRARITRAQSAPPSMASAVSQSTNSNTAPICSAPGYGSLKAYGSPNRPIYIQSTWPTPAIPRPESPIALLPPAILAEPARPVGSQPQAVPNAPRLLPTILEEATRPTRPPRLPLTQLHFDEHGRLLQSVAVLVSSSPEDKAPPPRVQHPRRLPQPFPLIPDPDFFSYPPPEPRERLNNTPLTPLRQHSVAPSTHSSEALEFPASPFLNTPSQPGQFVNFSPTDGCSTALKDRETHCPRSDAESETEDCARMLFKNGITPSSSSIAKRNPVASSSKATKVSKKRGLPNASTSKPSKIRKTVSRKTRATSAPIEDSGNGPDSMYLPDPK